MGSSNAGATTVGGNGLALGVERVGIRVGKPSCLWAHLATRAAVLVVGLAWIGVAHPTARADKPSEVSVKAAFVVSFLKFVEWPPTPAGTPMVLVVVGDGPMAEALKSGTDGLQIGGRPVHMRVARQPDDVDAADAVFIAASQQRHVPGILRQLDRRTVLTIGDGEGYAASGVVLNLVIQDDRVRVEANTAAAARAGLRVSAHLLRLARIVG